MGRRSAYLRSGPGGKTTLRRALERDGEAGAGVIRRCCPQRARQLAVDLEPADLEQAVRVFGLQPTASMHVELAARKWRHQTHRAYDDRYLRFVCVVAEAARRGEEMAQSELAARAGVHKSSACRYWPRLEAQGSLFRTTSSGQLVEPGGLGRMPKVAWNRYETCRYGQRWIAEMGELLEDDVREAIAMAWHLARAGHSVQLLGVWLRWRGGRGLEQIRAAWGRHQRQRRRSCRRQRRAARAAAQAVEQGIRAPQTGRVEGLTRLSAVLPGIAPSARTKNCNATEEGAPSPPSGALWGPRTGGRARQKSLLPNQARLIRAARAASDPAAAPQLLEEAYRLCLQVGDTNPGRLQEQLLELAERTGLSLDAWVGRWQHAVDSVRDELREALERGERCTILRAAAVAWWRCRRGVPGDHDDVQAPASGKVDPAHTIEPQRRPEAQARDEAPPPTRPLSQREATIRMQLELAERHGHEELATRLRDQLVSLGAGAGEASDA